MSKREVYAYTQITTDSAIMTTAGIFYGVFAYCNTTGPSKVRVYDDKTTATGTLIWAASATGSAADQQLVIMPTNGIACRTGIYANVTMTSGVDNIVVFWGPSP